MSELAENLFATADKLDTIVKRAESAAVAKPLQKVRDAANEVGRAWSGGWLGYHSRVYYANFEPVPAGAHFSTEWGFDTNYVTHPTIGDWSEFTFDQVRAHIFAVAGVKSLDDAEEFAKKAGESFQEAREEVLSVLTLAIQKAANPFLDRLKSQVDGLKLTSKFDFARAAHPRGQFMTRDMHAVQHGIQTPPHLSVIAEVCAIQNATDRCSELAKVARRAASHLDVQTRHQSEKQRIGTNVFIGHGRSYLWRDLKDFIQDRLGLPWDEFNRVPVAGVTNITRLSQMLDDAAIAFLVLTGEDEQADAKLHPRMNVVHEAGLFQGRLGFSRAIILLEEGCEEFSNVEGLGQIRFPKGNIKAAFEEIRRVLEREGLIEP
jgi:predicted nucleotide-binding protein